MYDRVTRVVRILNPHRKLVVRVYERIELDLEKWVKPRLQHLNEGNTVAPVREFRNPGDFAYTWDPTRFSWISSCVGFRRRLCQENMRGRSD